MRTKNFGFWAVFTGTRVSTLFLGLSLTFFSGGCSPGMFFGNHTDQGVLDGSSYRKIDTACAKMNLSSSTLDVQTFRSILHCFNSNGALEPIQQLVNGPHGLSDAELAPLVNITNQYFLSNPKRLYQFEKTYQALEKQGLVDDAFKQLSRLLENQEFITGSIAVLKTGFFSPYRADILKMIEQVSTKLTPNNLQNALDIGINVTSSKSYEKLITKLRPNKRHGLDYLKPTVESLFQYLKQDHTYLCDGKPTPIKNEMIQMIASQELFQTLDNLLGKTEGDIATKLPKMAATLQALFNADQNHPDHMIVESLASAFHDLNGEIQCMKGSNKIPNGAMHLMHELALLKPTTTPTEYFLKELPLTLAGVKPFCNLPDGLANEYTSLIQLARTGAMDPLSETLKEFYKVEAPWKGCNGDLAASQEKYHPLSRLLINFFGDQQNGFKFLLPVLKEMTDRNVWDDLLLVMSAPSDEDQNHLREAIQFSVEPSPQLGGKSILDITTAAITQSNSLPLFRWISSIEKYMGSTDPIAAPLFTTARKAFYANNIHPYLDVVREMTSDASQNEKLYETLFLISDRKEFLDSVSLVSRLAKNGGLKDLTNSMVTLFHQFLQNNGGNPAIENGVAPPVHLSVRHHFSGEDLQPFKFSTLLAKTVPTECDQINLDYSLADTSDLRFNDQIANLLKCQNGIGNLNDISTAIHYLNNTLSANGSSMLSFQIDLTKRLFENPDGTGQPLSSSEVSTLFKAWTTAYDDGRFGRLLDALALWAHGSTGTPTPTPSTLPHPTPSNAPGTNVFASTTPVLRSAISVLGSVFSKAKVDIQELESYSAQVLARNDFPQLMGDLDDLLNYTPPPSLQSTPDPTEALFYTPRIPGTDSLKDRIKKWVDAKECTDLPAEPLARAAKVNQRADEIIQEAKESRTAWDLVKSKPRLNWTLDELKAGLNPLLDKLTDPTQSVPDQTLLNAVVTFTKYFSKGTSTTGPHSQFAPEYLLKWLYDRSVDFRPITYYFPGEKTPRVRLVNTLDALELMLINVDFDAPPPLSKNLGLEFLAELGDAWGDVDRKNWPAKIQKKYSDPAHPPMTLLEAVNDITNRQSETGLDNLDQLIDIYVGLPELPSCHRNVPGEVVDRQAPTGFARDYMSPEEIFEFQVRLYNLAQVISMLKENCPGSGKGFNGGLEVLRDLFYEINYSTPDRPNAAPLPSPPPPPFLLNPTLDGNNNLTVVMRMVRLGFLRQIGRLLIHFDPKDPTLNDLMTTVVRSSMTRHSQDAFGALLGTPQHHELFWSLMSVVFETLENDPPETLNKLKQLGLYTLAIPNRLETWTPDNPVATNGDLLDLMLWRMSDVFRDYQGLLQSEDSPLKDILKSDTLHALIRANYDVKDPVKIARQRDFIKDFLNDSSGRPGSGRIKNVMEIANSIYGNRQIKAVWNELLSNSQALTHSPLYENLKVVEAVRPILNFLEQRGASVNSSASPEDAALARKLTLYSAQVLQNHELDSYLYLAEQDPEGLFKVFDTLGKYAGASEDKTGLREFLKMIRRSLSEPAHLMALGFWPKTG